MSKRYSRALVGLGGIALIGAHVIALHHVRSRFSVSVGATVAVAVLIVAMHVGTFGTLRERFRRRS